MITQSIRSIWRKLFGGNALQRAITEQQVAVITEHLQTIGSHQWGFVRNEVAQPPPPRKSTDVPGLIPDRAKSGRWERFHLFSPYAKLPTREFGGLHCWEPPLAGICPECDLKGQAHGQSYAMFGSDGTRKCTFCGVTTKVHGSRLYWWFENEVVEASQWTGEKT